MLRGFVAGHVGINATVSTEHALNVGGSVSATAFVTSNADHAEWHEFYEKKEMKEEFKGDVVTIKDGKISWVTNDQQHPIITVISTNPGIKGNQPSKFALSF